MNSLKIDIRKDERSVTDRYAWFVLDAESGKEYASVIGEEGENFNTLEACRRSLHEFLKVLWGIH